MPHRPAEHRFMAGSLIGRPLAGYGLAIGSAAAALGLRLLLGGVVPQGFPFLSFFPAIVVTTYLAGTRPGIICALVSFLAAWFIVIEPVQNFSMSSDALAAFLVYTIVAGVMIAIISAMQRALDQLQAERVLTARLYEQQRGLFEELQHRVANNMAFISALLRLQKRRIHEDPAGAAEAFDEAVARIDIMGQVHRRLYDPAAANAALQVHLQAMCDELLLATGAVGVRCIVELPAMQFPLEKLLPLSLLVAEVVTNSLKHGFAGRAAGVIRIGHETDHAGRPVLVIRDDGVGLPAEHGTGRGLGLRIIAGLAAQIDGTVTTASDGGAVTRVHLPA